ncbi:hypothetical protein GPJ56_007234 [Histomonas meleagridis]|nr:hypothetical protein GPJ56_007234 [Histomonas meleagridis]
MLPGSPHHLASHHLGLLPGPSLLVSTWATAWCSPAPGSPPAWVLTAHWVSAAWPPHAPPCCLVPPPDWGPHRLVSTPPECHT